MPECACLDTILTAGADVPCVQLRPAAAHKRAQTIGAALEHFGRLCRAHKLQIATVRLALPQAVSRCTRGKVLIVGSPPGRLRFRVCSPSSVAAVLKEQELPSVSLSTQRQWWLGRLGLIGAQSCTANCAGGLHCAGFGVQRLKGRLVSQPVSQSA